MFTIIAASVAVAGLLFFFSGMIRVMACLAVLIGGGLGSVAATSKNIGVEGFEHEDGVSLRQESTNGNRGFFMYYVTRSHRGGGLAGGR